MKRELKIDAIKYNKNGFLLTMDKDNWLLVNKADILVKNSQTGVEKIFHFIEQSNNIKTFKTDNGLVLIIRASNII